MQVDVAASERYTRLLARAERRGRERRAERLRRARMRVDERFDPEKALAGTARYLSIAGDRLGREDLSFVSYHMGIGNLEGVLDAYGNAQPTYVQLYFDVTPTRHRRAYRLLAALGDDSSNYWWKLLAAREIMRMHREDPGRLGRLAVLHTAKASAEEVLHPADRTEVFATPEDLAQAWDDGEIVPFPQDETVTGLQRDGRMGELARRIDQPAERYRGLRPEALAMALYIGAQVREISGQSPLVVTSTVRDGAYQRELVARNGEATRHYSLHTTGWAFDVLRDYRSRRQALAFQFVLDRLRSLNAISWVREPRAIHITAASRRRGAASAARSCEHRRHDRRDPHARRAARGPARLPVGAALPAGRRAADGARRRGRRRAGGDVARRADLGLPVAQGRRARCSTRATGSCCPTSPASAAPTSRWIPTGTRTTATWRWRPRCWRTSTCAARRSWSTTGAGRSACGSPSSTASASTAS